MRSLELSMSRYEVAVVVMGAVPALRTELGVVLRLRDLRISRPLPLPFDPSGGILDGGGHGRRAKRIVPWKIEVYRSQAARYLQ